VSMFFLLLALSLVCCKHFSLNLCACVFSLLLALFVITPFVCTIFAFLDFVFLPGIVEVSQEHVGRHKFCKNVHDWTLTESDRWQIINVRCLLF
jgi:hypothetical protein